MVFVGLSKVGEGYALLEAGHQFIAQDDELLVGGGIDIELIAFLAEQGLQPHGHVDGMTRQFEVEPVSKQGLELKAY